MAGFTWVFVALTAAHAGLLGAGIWALDRENAVFERYAADPASILRPGAVAAVDLVDRIGGLVDAGLYVYLLLFVAWFTTVGLVATGLGHDRRAVLRHWTHLLWRIVLVPVVVFVVLSDERPVPGGVDRAAFRDAALALNRADMGFSAARIVMLGLVAAFAVIVWRRLSRPVARAASA